MSMVRKIFHGCPEPERLEREADVAFTAIRSALRTAYNLPFHSEGPGLSSVIMLLRARAYDLEQADKALKEQVAEAGWSIAQPGWRGCPESELSPEEQEARGFDRSDPDRRL